MISPEDAPVPLPGRSEYMHPEVRCRGMFEPACVFFFTILYFKIGNGNMSDQAQETIIAVVVGSVMVLGVLVVCTLWFSIEKRAYITNVPSPAPPRPSPAPPQPLPAPPQPLPAPPQPLPAPPKPLPAHSPNNYARVATPPPPPPPAPSNRMDIINWANSTTSYFRDSMYKFLAPSFVRGPQTRFLCYVNGDGGVNFASAIKTFFKGTHSCWDPSWNVVLFASNYKNDRVVINALMNMYLTLFFASLKPGDILVLFLLTPGNILADPVLDNIHLARISALLPRGVTLILYTPSPVLSLPFNTTVGEHGEITSYVTASTGIDANVIALSDAWQGYTPPLDLPTFPVNTYAKVPVLLNFMSLASITATKFKTMNAFFKDYSSRKWHCLHRDNDRNGTCTFRPIISTSLSNSLHTPCPLNACPYVIKS